MSLRFLPPIRHLLLASAAPVIVTGAGGWLGAAVLEMLREALGAAFAQRVSAFTATPRPLALRGGGQVAAEAFSALATRRTGPGLIFHFGFLTRGHAGQPFYVETNRGITRTMQDFIARNGALGMFIPSSGAVYGEPDMSSNPYGVLKLEDEAIYAARGARMGFPTAIIRVFNLAGPFINNLDNYALASIITDILRGGAVKLRAAQPVWRSYTHVQDVLNIAAAIMLQALSVPVFDTAGDPAIEIGDLASRAAQLLTGGAVKILRPAWRDAPANCYLGNIDDYAKVAGVAGVELQSLDRQIRDTAGYLEGR